MYIIVIGSYMWLPQDNVILFGAFTKGFQPSNTSGMNEMKLLIRSHTPLIAMSKFGNAANLIPHFIKGAFIYPRWD